MHPHALGPHFPGSPDAMRQKLTAQALSNELGQEAEVGNLDRTVVVDCRVDPSEQCFPMIPSGAAALDMVEYEERVEAAS